MVATDIFGRGIDVVKVNTVINYDMPEDPDSYMHRVGRAGRFGTKGLTITFIVDEKDQKIFDEIQKRFLIKASELPDNIDPSTYSVRFYILIFCSKINNIQLLRSYFLFLNFDLNKNYYNIFLINILYLLFKLNSINIIIILLIKYFYLNLIFNILKFNYLLNLI
jgi:hypothetical protein